MVSQWHQPEILYESGMVQGNPLQSVPDGVAAITAGGDSTLIGQVSVDLTWTL